MRARCHKRLPALTGAANNCPQNPRAITRPALFPPCGAAGSHNGSAAGWQARGFWSSKSDRPATGRAGKFPCRTGYSGGDAGTQPALATPPTSPEPPRPRPALAAATGRESSREGFPSLSAGLSCLNHTADGTVGETVGKIDWRNGGSLRKNCFFGVVSCLLYVALQLVSFAGETVGETV